MSKTIYYFSGTGNSLHVAKELQNRLQGSKLVPIVKLLKDEEVTTEAETVGFVFPTYFTTVPAPVRRFIEKIDMPSARYIFSITTRIGTFCVANRNVEQILKKKGKNLDLQLILNMASNSPTGLKPGKGDENWVKKIDEEKVSELEHEVKSKLDLIHRIILSQEKYPPKTFPNPFLSFLERIMYFLTSTLKGEINYYTDSTCTGCGICESVCLSNKIRIQNNCPVWEKDVNCYYCYACFNFCPTQSILVKDKYSKKDGRYHHPNITLNDIVNQKLE